MDENRHFFVDDELNDVILNSWTFHKSILIVPPVRSNINSELFYFAQSAGAVEYTDCTSAEG